MNQTLERIKRKNLTHSQQYCSPSVSSERDRWFFTQRVKITAVVCMDGRVLLTEATTRIPGSINKIRIAGAQGDLGFPFFGQVILDQYTEDLKSGMNSLFLCTYHFSKSDTHLGCKAHGYDTKKARETAERLRVQFCFMFGIGVAYPLVLGIETDSLGLVFCSSKEEYVVSDHISASTNDLKLSLRTLYQDMPDPIFKSVLELAKGNQELLKANNHGEINNNLDHAERVVALGRGLNFIAESTGSDDVSLSNFVLEVSPFHQDYINHLVVAIQILIGNERDGRITKEEGMVFLASGLYHDEVGPSKQFAVLKAEYHRAIFIKAVNLLKEINSEDYRYLVSLGQFIELVEVVVNEHTRNMTIVNVIPLNNVF